MTLALILTMVPPPFNFQKWVEDNKELLKPPVGNKCLLRTDGYFIMVVGGPNERADFHYQPTEELFYQVKGTMYLRILEDGEFKCIEIKEGEIFMLPSYTMHSPYRLPGTIGVVLERTRELPDKMFWYCPNLSAHDNKPFLLHEMQFQSKNIFEELPICLKTWEHTESLRVCKGCGYTAAPLESPCKVPTQQ
ncbi:3-hydroxyanthranilic acid dioxygenase [Malassezia pachydermatis]